MSAADMHASEYFLAPADSYWQWQDRGNVIAWADGTTIAFRSELLAVLKRLETQSLPPIGAIVLLLAACRDSWHQPPGKIAILRGLLSAIETKSVLNTLLLARVGAALDRIGAFSAPLRSSLEAKTEIAATVFEQRTLTFNPPDISQLIRVFEEGLPETMLMPQPDMSAAVCLQRDLVHLAAGLDRLDESALVLRLRTGLEQQVRPADVALPELTTARGLISDLKDDAELGGLARLAQRLMAVVNLPTPLSQPEELPLGGVSDISNRGPLDRLLVSELAQDNLTLAARLANNEALYLRRETPPRVPTRRRLVLLDSGLRMWGVPRVFATAVGLAVAAGATERLEISVYRADGSQLVPVDMNRIEGLNDHLAALDYRAHPGAALAAFVELAAEFGQAADLVLVTGEDVLEDMDFRRKLAEAGFAELYLAIVGRDGHFQLLLQTLRGRKRLHAAQLALDDVLVPTPKPTVPLLTPPSSVNLPAIFQVKPFPIRLSVPVDPQRSWHVADFGILTYTRDGRLLHWDDPRYGARQLVENLPPGQLQWAASENKRSGVVAVIGPAYGNLFAVWLQEDSGRCLIVKLEPFKDQPRWVFVDRGGAIFVHSRSMLCVYNPQTGEALCCVPVRADHVRGRFFKQYDAGRTPEKRWVTPAFDGRDVHWHSLNEEGRPLLTIFEATGHEGPLGITSDGQIVSLGGEQPHRVRYPQAASSFRVEGIARNGGRIALSMDLDAFQGPPGRKHMIVNVHIPEAQFGTASNSPWLLEPDLYTRTNPVLLRHRFREIGVDDAGQLLLVGRHGTCWPLVIDRKAGTLALPRSPSGTVPVKRKDFVPLDCPNRCELARAVFEDGSQALIDSRGLLHLKSSDSEVPECVIVLAEGATAGCTSSGLYWGPEYFWGPPESRPRHWSRVDEPDEPAVGQIIHRFVERLR